MDAAGAVATPADRRGRITDYCVQFRHGSMTWDELVDKLVHFRYKSPPHYGSGPTNPVERMAYIDEHANDNPKDTIREVSRCVATGLLTVKQKRAIMLAIARKGKGPTPVPDDSVEKP